MRNESLTVVIPVYNESESIETVLTQWHHSLKRLDIAHDLVVINDGSTDQTGEILNRLSLKWNFLNVYNQDNAGHGAAIKYGYSIACSMKNDYIFQTDSDLQFSPADFDKFWADRHEYQAIFGIRENRQDSPLRKIITGLLHKVIFDIYNVDIPDANIPYRLFHKSYLRNLVATLPTGVFAPNIFLSLLCFKSSAIKTKSMAVRHFDRSHGQPKLIRFGLVKACIKSFVEIFKFSYSISEKIEFVNEKVSQDQYHTQQENQAPASKEKYEERHLHVA